MSHSRLALSAGAACGFLTVALGAFGAHGLEDILTPDRMITYQTGIEYQAYHSLALILSGILASTHSGKSIQIAIWSFITGIILFSGSLYLLAISQTSWLGIITPFGGTAFLIGWAFLFISAYKNK